VDSNTGGIYQKKKKKKKKDSRLTGLRKTDMERLETARGKKEVCSAALWGYKKKKEQAAFDRPFACSERNIPMETLYSEKEATGKKKTAPTS